MFAFNLNALGIFSSPMDLDVINGNYTHLMSECGKYTMIDCQWYKHNPCLALKTVYILFVLCDKKFIEYLNE